MPMRLKLFPHSWLEIESPEAVVYVDPSYVERYYPGGRGPAGADGLPEAMPTGDLILISHGDFDHLNPETIDRLRDERTRVLCPLACLEQLGQIASPVKEGDELEIGGIRIDVVPAYNTREGRSTSKHHLRGESVGYVIEVRGRRIYHAGDTDLIPEMGELRDVYTALLPIGGTFTMDVDEAVEAALRIEPELAIPMHTRGQADPGEFVQKLRKRRAPFSAAAPAPGEPVEIPERRTTYGEASRRLG